MGVFRVGVGRLLFSGLGRRGSRFGIFFCGEARFGLIFEVCVVFYILCCFFKYV